MAPALWQALGRLSLQLTLTSTLHCPLPSQDILKVEGVTNEVGPGSGTLTAVFITWGWGGLVPFLL